MIPQQPAEGILKTNDWGDSKVYKIVCGCGQPDHDHNVWVESDQTGINVNIFITAKSDCWSEVVKSNYDINNAWLQEFDWYWKGILNGLWTRCKLTWTLWTTGYIKTETTISMTEQQTLNYAESLKSAVHDVKEFRKANEHC